MTGKMKTNNTLQTIIRTLQAGAALAAVLAPLVALFGLVMGWRTATEYSNGMFVMGSAVIIFGLLAVWGGFTSRGSFAITYAQSVSDMSMLERGKLWMIDSLRGYQTVGVMAVCGLLLIAISVFIGEVLLP
jgi:hypothetical protein